MNNKITCADRLVQLDIRNNPFLQIRGNYCNVSKYIFVEIFHTAESIRNVSPYYDLVQVEGPDHPPLALSGREKIKTCTVCNNIYIISMIKLLKKESLNLYR